MSKRQEARKADPLRGDQGSDFDAVPALGNPATTEAVKIHQIAAARYGDPETIRRGRQQQGVHPSPASKNQQGMHSVSAP
uniref:Uncharacterized protein n=1 Tax=Solibacter usitatus (strain Ellin6076) TaxID=234267 RepID=Q029F4_SOLUE